MANQVDKNLIVEATINKNGMSFYPVPGEPFSVHGVWWDTDRFYRVPRAVAETVSKNIVQKCDQTAGGRVRFRTNSPSVAIMAELHNTEQVAMMTPLSTMGFDLYADGIFVRSFVPPYGQLDGHFESKIAVGDKSEKEILIHFPLYSGVKALYIGVVEGSTLSAAEPYKYEKPVVYYGSSITNGAAASRPGMTYEAMLSRWLGVDHHNLGFGGSAKGEREIAEYVASLEMSVFVYDYDYNAPSVEHLEQTHERMFKIVREKHPDTPIIIVSRPKYVKDEDCLRRFEVIKTTYEHALAAGDERVYLVCGSDLFEGLDADYTVDAVHPTDLGFRYMAQGLRPVLEDALSKI